MGEDWVLSVVSDRKGKEMRSVMSALYHETCDVVGVCQQESSVSAGTNCLL